MYFLCELPLCEKWWSVVSFSDDWPPTCETFILWRKLCVSPKNVDEEHHFWAKKIPLKLTPELVATLKFSDWMGCASITTWFPFSLRWGWIGLLLQQKSTISPAENVVWSGGGGPTSPIWPWGPTWTWMSCPAGLWGSSFMLALRETLSTYWTNQSSYGWSIVASKRLGQTCPHPMPYCTVRIVLLWDVRVVICALRCRQNFTTMVVSV